MAHRRAAAQQLGRAVVAGVGLALAVGACGQADPGGSPATTAGPGTPTTTPSVAAGTPAPSPGPDATPGCEVLVGPVHRLVTGQVDSGVGSEEVRRLADGVEDNALSTVASRISGLVVQQPAVDPSTVDAQWEQFARLCDLD
ncbi:hypothetical protein ABIE38_003269 [Dietzia sp. 2505]|uniref:hypothetical protein n=1 Tax=Dietzia sp. 2505 TaxID=3156457 RepID=UPI003392A9E6